MRVAIDYSEGVGESSPAVVQKGVQGWEGPAFGELQFVKPLLVVVQRHLVVYIVFKAQGGVEQFGHRLLQHQVVEFLGEAGGVVEREPHDGVEHLQGDIRQAHRIVQVVLQVRIGDLQLLHALFFGQAVFKQLLSFVEVLFHRIDVLPHNGHALAGQQHVAVSLHHILPYLLIGFFLIVFAVPHEGLGSLYADDVRPIENLLAQGGGGGGGPWRPEYHGNKGARFPPEELGRDK